MWKISLKNIHQLHVLKRNYQYLKNLKLCDENKLKILYDPIIHIKEIRNNIKNKIEINEDFYMAVGRLTAQKNFVFLCKCFNKLLKKNLNLKLYILGEGEDFYLIKNYIQKNNLTQNIKLLGHIENVMPYYKKSKGFILSSLWEDPGFVLIEAAFCRSPVYSSNAKPGPYEIIKDNINGTNFNSNDVDSFVKSLMFFKKFKR